MEGGCCFHLKLARRNTWKLIETAKIEIILLHIGGTRFLFCEIVTPFQQVIQLSSNSVCLHIISIICLTTYQLILKETFLLVQHSTAPLLCYQLSAITQMYSIWCQLLALVEAQSAYQLQLSCSVKSLVAATPSSQHLYNYFASSHILSRCTLSCEHLWN